MKTWDSEPLIITIAPVGAEVTREHHPGVPFTPEEIALSSLEAVAAGASVVHLHARLSAALRSVMRRCASGGTDLAQCLPPRSGANGWSECGPCPTGVGTSTRSS